MPAIDALRKGMLVFFGGPCGRHKEAEGELEKGRSVENGRRTGFCVRFFAPCPVPCAARPGSATLRKKGDFHA